MKYTQYFSRDSLISQYHILKRIKLPMEEHRYILNSGICHAMAFNWLVKLHEGHTIRTACQHLSGALPQQSKSETTSLHRQIVYQQLSMEKNKKLTDEKFRSDTTISVASRGHLRQLRNIHVSSFDPDSLARNLDDILCYSNLYLIKLMPNHAIAIGRDRAGRVGLFDSNYGIIEINFQHHEKIGGFINMACRHYQPCFEIFIQSYG